MCDKIRSFTAKTSSMTQKSYITLTMIVKNEEKTLPRLLRSLKPHINAAVIHDTGSTDSTIDVIKKELKGIPCKIRSVKWKSFGENRTAAINDVDNDGYILLADADFEFFINDGAFDNLTADGYFIQIKEDALTYSLVALIKDKLDWKYVGRTHEYLNHADKTTDVLDSSKIFIKHHHDGGSRENKFIRDLQLLLEDHEDDPDNVRTVFYLAQTYECLGNIDKAVYWYLQRAQMGGWAEEVYVAMLRLGRLQNSVRALLEAYSFRPERLEALYEAVIRLRGAPNAVISLLQGKLNCPASKDILFVEQYIWDYALKFELALAYSSVQRHCDAVELYNEILNSNVPKKYSDFIQQRMLDFAPST